MPDLPGSLLRVTNFVALVICTSLLVGLISINTLEIVLRAFFSTSLSWIHETNVLLASWLYFIGIAIIYHNHRDITVSLIIDRLSLQLKRAASRLYALITGAVFLVIAYESWRLIELQFPFQTPGVGYPRFVYTLPLFISATIIGFESILRAIAPGQFTPAPSVGDAMEV